MLRPSHSDLMEKLNQTSSDVITSRYIICIAVAKRARQLIDKAEPLTDTVKPDKSVSLAVEELWRDLIRVNP